MTEKLPLAKEADSTIASATHDERESKQPRMTKTASHADIGVLQLAIIGSVFEAACIRARGYRAAAAYCSTLRK